MKLPIKLTPSITRPVLARPVVPNKPSEIVSPPKSSVMGFLAKSSAASASAKQGSSSRYDSAEDVKVIRSKRDEREFTPALASEYIIVVCDTPSSAVYEKGLGMGKKAKELFLNVANDKNIPTDLFEFVSPCPPMPEEILGTSASKESAWLKEHRLDFIARVKEIETRRNCRPSAMLALGLHATQQAMGKAVKITRVRGQIRQLEDFNLPVIPMLSPGQIFRQPGYEEQFRVDFDMLARLRQFNYSLDAAELAIKDVDYSYISGQKLLELLEKEKPSAIAFDTETYNGGGSNSWWAGSKPFIVQISWAKGESYVIPIQSFRQFETRTKEELAKKPYDYWTVTEAEAAANLACIKSVLEGNKHYYTGHNLTYDWNVMQNMGVTPNLAMWMHDSMQLMFVRDENTQSKDLATGTKLYVPDLSGYSDAFEAKADYSEMPRMHPDDMLFYSAADSDTCLRMTKYLVGLTAKDERHYNCYTRIQMPSLRMFYTMERKGMLIDKCKIREFTDITKEAADSQYEELIAEVHPDIRLKYIDNKKPKNGLSFKRRSFLSDILFTHPEGLRLVPTVFTKSTSKLADDLKVPSCSAKDHLPYFEDNPWVAAYQEYNKFNTILQFAGVEADDGNEREVPGGEALDGEVKAKGIWKYIAEDGAIHPSYFLHRTVTGRCLTADSEVVTNLGYMTMERIEEVMDNNPHLKIFVQTHTNRMKRVKEYVWNGVKKVYEVTTASGYKIRATANHPFWTPDGWKQLNELTIDSEVMTLPYSKSTRAAEEWRPCTVHKDYQVSNRGRVWYNGGKFNIAGHCHIRNKGDFGHTAIPLGEDIKAFPIHRLVALAFLGEPEVGQEVLHINGLSGDNRVENLRWGTSQENKLDTLAHGRSRRQNNNLKGKLTIAQVEEIREKCKSEMFVTVAKEYGVSDSLIRGIFHGSRWEKPVISPQVPDRIVSIRYAGEEETYDLSVEDDHSFIANHFVVHNTASANPNGQNIPKHGKLAKAYRAIFVARPGKLFISVDLSQAELRMAAWESKDRTMLALYNEGKDLHAATAARTMGLAMEEFFELDELTRDVKRQGAKAVNFGYLFGMWWKKFKAYAKTTYGVTVTDTEAEKSRSDFFGLYNSLERWHKQKKEFVNETGYVRSIHGRIRHLPSIRSYDKGVRGEAERQSINSTIQGFASDWGLIAAVRFHRDANPYEVAIVSTIHDALILEVDEDKAEHYASAVKWYMQNQPMEEWFGVSPPLPILSDIEIGPNLKDLRKMPHIQAIKPCWFTHD